MTSVHISWTCTFTFRYKPEKAFSICIKIQSAENCFFVMILNMYLFAGMVEICSNVTHLRLMLHFYTPWKRQKTRGLLTFSESIGLWNIGLKWVDNKPKFFSSLIFMLTLSKHHNSITVSSLLTLTSFNSWTITILFPWSHS